MTQLLTLTAGAEVDCVDENCGRVDWALVDPSRKVLRHLAVERPGSEPGRLVPFDHVQSMDEHVRLDCSSAEYEMFERAVVSHEIPSLVAPALGGPLSHTVLTHNVPEGEVELRTGEDVRADDGRVGRLQKVVVNADDGSIQRIVITIGHLFNKREISVPASFVANFDDDAVQLAGSKNDFQVTRFESS